MKQTSVDSVRFEKFSMKMGKESKSLNVLPPCHSIFLAALFKSSHVPGIWKRSIVRDLEIPESQNYGCTAAGGIQWVKEIFPNDIMEILVSNEFDEENAFEEDCESDDGEF